MSDTKGAAVAQKVQIVKDAAGAARIRTGKLAQKLGFPGVLRSPQRRELAALQGEVATWQPDPLAAGLAKELEAAIAAIYQPGDREQQVKAAEVTIANVRTGLKQLADQAAAAEKSRKDALPSKGELKDLKEAKKELTGQLDEVVAGLGKSVDAVRLPATSAHLEPMALQATAATIRASIGAMTTEGMAQAANQIANQIEQLRTSVGEAAKQTQAGTDYLEHEAKDSLGELNESLKRIIDADADYKGPLATILEKLESAIKSTPANPDVVRALIKQAEDEVDVANTDVAPIFGAQSATADAEAAANGKTMRERLESMLESWRGDVQFLIDNHVPNTQTVLDDLATLRTDAGKPIANADMKQATLDMRASVDAVRVYAQNLRATELQAAATEAQAVQALIATTKAAFKTEYDAHKDSEAVQADFRAVDSQIGSAIDIIPASGAIPPTLTRPDVALARTLITEAKTTLDGIATNKAALDSFKDDTKATEKSLDKRGFLGKQIDKLAILAPLREDAKGVLAQHDPEAAKDFQKRYDALIKALPDTPSKDSLAELTKLKTEVDAATATMTTTADYLTKIALPKLAEMDKKLKDYKNEDGVVVVQKQSAAMDRLYQERAFGLDAQYRPMPKSYTTALEALRTATEEKPPVEATLRAAVDAAKDELMKALLMPTEDRVAAAYTDRDADTKQDEEDKKQQAVEKKALLPLERTYGAAQAAVAKVKGDRNALQAAGRLLEQIKSDIDNKAFTGLPVKTKDLDHRLKQLMANPRGEMNNRRNELPAVINELRSAVATAQAALLAVRDEIRSHDPADKAEKKATISALNLMRSYRKLLDGRVDAMADAAKPINDTKVVDEDARRTAREDGLRLMRAFRDQLRTHPMTKELLGSPFPDAKSSLEPIFQALIKYEYTLTTCI